MEQTIFQKIAKIISAIVIFFAIAFFGYIGGGVVKYNLDVRKADKSVEKFQDSLEQPYKEDTYGGKTPEETWGMFLDALKRGDIELASRYYDVGHQKKAKEWLEKIKQNNKLERKMKEMESLQKSSEKSLEGRSDYYYDYFNEEFQQILSASITFYLNPYTKVWKILW